MTIVGSLGILFEGNTSPLRQSADEAGGILSNFVERARVTMDTLAAVGESLSSQISAPVISAVRGMVQEWWVYEKELTGVTALMAEGFDTKKLETDIRKLRDVFQIDDKRVMGFMGKLKGMGVADKDLTNVTTATLALSKGTGQAEMSAYRMITAYQNGNTVLFERYIPALREATSAEEKQALVNEFLQKNIERASKQSAEGAGAQQKFANAVADIRREIGELFTETLPLTNLINMAVGVFRALRERIEELSPATKRWITALALVAVGIGPVMSFVGTAIPIIMALGKAFITVGTSILKVLVPAVLVAGAAFAGWNLGKTLNDVKIGSETIGSWVQLWLQRLMQGWDTLLETLPRKAEIAYAKTRRFFAKDENEGKWTAQIEAAEAALKEINDRHERLSKANDESWRRQADENNKTAITSFGGFWDRFAENGAESFGKIKDAIGGLVGKLGGGEIGAWFDGVLKDIQAKIPGAGNLDQLAFEGLGLPGVGKDQDKGLSGSSGPSHAAALEKGSVAAYSAELASQRSLSKIEKSGQMTADNTKKLVGLVGAMLDAQPEVGGFE
jgi:hypothetical protein